MYAHHSHNLWNDSYHRVTEKTQINVELDKYLQKFVLEVANKSYEVFSRSYESFLWSSA